MINVITLAALSSRALPNKTIASSAQSISKKLPLDAAVSEMDGVLLCPDDLKGANLNILSTAIRNKHSSVCVMYIYTKATDANKLAADYKKQVRKINETEIAEFVNSSIGDHYQKTGRTYVSSNQFVAVDSADDSNIVDTLSDIDAKNNTTVLNNVATGGVGDLEEAEELEDADELEEAKELEDAEDIEETNIAGSEEAEEIEELEEEDEPQAHINVPPTPTRQVIKDHPLTSMSMQDTMTTNYPYDQSAPKGNKSTVEERIMNITNVNDWDMYREHLNRESITKHLIEENTEYIGLVNYISVIDEKINTIWRDPNLSASDKLNKIKDLGNERSIQKAAVNSLHVDKLISVITAIIESASRTANERIESIDKALYKITTDKESLLNTDKIDYAIQKRMDVQLELLEMARSVVDLYKTIDNVVDDEIKDLDRNLPSNNAFINHMVEQTGIKILTPVNSASLAVRITQALQENRIKASQVESKIRNLVDLIFEMCESSEEVIRYQDDMIHTLRANRVEDVVIVDSLLKECLRLYIGGNGSGVHTTAITWSGVLSRRNNTLLIDLTTRPKFEDLGIECCDVEKFMNERIEKHLLCLKTYHKLSLNELQSLINEVKTRLNYYMNINIILDEDDEEYLDQLSNDAKTVHYITNCSLPSLNKLKQIYSYNTVANIARIMIMIEPPISPLRIADKLEIDYTSTKILTIPNMTQIKACEITQSPPYESSDIVTVFEEAFR